MVKKYASYKFENNLLKLSKIQNINSALNEWVFVCNEQREIQNITCICQKKLKKVFYMYNKSTMKTIVVGGSCVKKFGSKEIKKNIYTKTASKIIKNINSNGEYDFINNIEEYSLKVQNDLIDYLENKLQININDEFKLRDLIEEINLITNEYNLNYLKNIYNKIENVIEKIQIENEKKRIENERIENERIENEKNKNEKKRIENEKKYYYYSSDVCSDSSDDDLSDIYNYNGVDYYRDKDGILYDMNTFENCYVISSRTNEIKKINN